MCEACQRVESLGMKLRSSVVLSRSISLPLYAITQLLLDQDLGSITTQLCAWKKESELS